VRASIVIAHPRSTIRNAHQVLVLDHGRIFERGTHDCLLQASGVYAELIKVLYPAHPFCMRGVWFQKVLHVFQRSCFAAASTEQHYWTDRIVKKLVIAISAMRGYPSQHSG
jgi:hypothetical protein